MKQASNDLNSSSKKLTPIQEQMDAYLKKNLPASILSGKFEEPQNTQQSEMTKLKGGARVMPLDNKPDDSANHLMPRGGTDIQEIDLISPGMSPKESSGKKIKGRKSRK